MDGFQTKESVIVIGATNFEKHLDEALKRPGRFDILVNVDLPDIKGREDLIELYLSKSTNVGEIDNKFWAKKTPGFSGADIENMINIAAIHAAVKGMYLLGW